MVEIENVKTNMFSSETELKVMHAPCPHALYLSLYGCINKRGWGWVGVLSNLFKDVTSSLSPCCRHHISTHEHQHTI